MRTPGKPGWRIAIAITMAVAGVLALRAFVPSVRAGDEPIRAWMTIPYIAHSRHVSENVLWTALRLPSHLHDHRPLGRIAREQGRPVGDAISSLKAAIQHAPALSDH